jgi:predicted ATPase/class 3 adenylate cyclase
MAELPTGTITLLFTDIEGSTRLLQRLGERYPGVLQEHRRLLQGAFQAHGGLEVEVQGDSFFVVFRRAVDGIAAAVAGQRALADHPWFAGGVVQVRMGLHTGEPARAGEGYAGLDVHRAARLSAAGHGGQVLLSASTRVLIEGKLPPGVSLRDLGEHRLKDLSRPEHIYQLVMSGLPSDFPTLRTLEARPNNLSVQPTTLIGREQDVKTVLGIMLRQDVRLLTLTGPAGTGKTRLGLQVAAELLDHFQDGVFFVALAPISDPELVASSIAQTLGIHEAAGRPLLDKLKDHLRNRQLLLVLDSFEQTLTAAPLVADLIGACPRIKVLITSRAVLRLRGEKDFQVPPLALPDPGRPLAAANVSQYPAIELFIHRALDVKPDFVVTAENAPVLAEICRRLDGLPLAIELAAARARLLPPQTMLARLERRLTLLTGGPRDLPVRQQTLRAAIAWSHDLLNEREQAMFRQLAVFVGGCTLEAAEAVCLEPTTEHELPIPADPSASGLSSGVRRRAADDVLDLLASLVDKSLLRQDEQEGEPRFSMLETVREYAVERLEASTVAELLRRRHAAHFLALAEQANPGLTGPRQRMWLEWFEREHDNLRAALDWTLERGEAELGLRLAGTLGRFWEVRGHLSEGQRRLERALSQCVGVASSARSGALQAAGNLAYIRGDYERAAALHQENLSLRRELEDHAGIAASLHHLSRVRFYQGDSAVAETMCKESLALRQELGDRHGIAMSLNTLGVIARNRGDHAAARALFEESLLLFRESGDKWGIGLLLNNLARVTRDLGDWAGTAALCTESLALFQEVGDRHGIAWVLSNLAIVAGSGGGWERASRLFGAAEALRASVGTSSLSLSPAERSAHEAAVASARARLGEDTFAALEAAGRAMSLEQAVAYALETTGRSGVPTAASSSTSDREPRGVAS